MSELAGLTNEFKVIATMEIKEGLSRITKILDSCQNDTDVSVNSSEIEKHVHKIKGVAPMMGKENSGKVAKHLDSILKQIISGNKVDGILEILGTSVEQMKIDMDNHHKRTEIQKRFQIFP